jgi:hypothetical protein
MKHLLTIGILSLLAAPVASAQSHLLVVSGLSGEPQHEEQFHVWAMGMITAAGNRFNLPADRITYLAEKPEKDSRRIAATSTKANIDAALTRIAGSAGPTDRVLILLIGHGSSDGQSSRINLPGPDLTASDLATMLGRFTTQQVVVVNAASASGAFQEPLLAQNRTIITSTKSGREQNESIFARFFVDAYAVDGADSDKDGRVSVLEAYDFANREVERFYKSDNRLQTEHSVLGGNREIARAFNLGGGAAVAASSSPEVEGLVAEKLALEAEVQALTARKAEMEEAEYQRELERLLLALARKNQEIRAKEGTE